MLKPLLLKNTLGIILISLLSLFMLGIFTLVTAFMIKKGLLWKGLFPLILILMFVGSVAANRRFGLIGLIITIISSWTIFGSLDLMFGDESALLDALTDLSIAPLILFIVIMFMGIFAYLTFSMQFLTKFEEKITIRTLLGKKVFAWSEVKATIAKQEADGSYFLTTTLKNDKSIYLKMTKEQMQHFVELCYAHYLSNNEEDKDDRPMLWKMTSSHIQKFYELLNAEDFDFNVDSEDELGFFAFIKFLEVFGLKHFSYDEDNDFELYELEYFNPEEDAEDKLAFFAFAAFLELFDIEHFSYDKKRADELAFFIFISNKNVLSELLNEEEYEDAFENLEGSTSNKMAEFSQMFLPFAGAIYGYSTYDGILGALLGYFISFIFVALIVDAVFSLLDKVKGIFHKKTKNWKAYDPSWLVEASQPYIDEYPWLSGALEKCTQVCDDDPTYIYFVESQNANQPGSAWQFQENITLEDTPEGEIILDIIEPNVVGGLEFFDKLD